MQLKTYGGKGVKYELIVVDRDFNQGFIMEVVYNNLSEAFTDNKILAIEKF